MRKRMLYSGLLLLLLLSLISGVVYAQTYYFEVPREIVDLTINADGSASLQYTYEFANTPSAGSIEYVDLGLPQDIRYEMSSVSASIDGQPITDIEEADPQYIEGGGEGITFGLGAYAIPPGQRGTFQANIGQIERILYPGEDADRPDYASFQFTPSYFGSSYVTGQTDLTVTIHLPPGVQPEESVYYLPSGGWGGPSEPVSGFDEAGNIFFTWQDPNGRVDAAYIFGAGFPARYVPENSIVTKPLIDPQLLICLGVTCLIVLVIIASIYGSVKAAKQRKLAYLPPKISIEGHGIKRGLTAIEAAILMEQPLDKILTMILFGLIKKGPVTVLKREPLAIQTTRPLPTDLHPYEVEFVDAFDKPDEKERTKALQDMFVGLVKSVSEKMKGFSRKETADYYQSIITQAWSQVEAAGTPDVKAKAYDESLEWTMMDKRFEDRTRDVFSRGPVFVPVWWGRYDPVYRGGFGGASATSTTPGVPSAGSAPSLPQLPGADFAASMVNGVQSFSAGVVGEITSFTSGITNKTNPVPKPTYTSTRSGGGGGGHSCACACACAGCACACAGGGR